MASQDQIVQLAIELTPAVMALLRSIHQQRQPSDAPELTDEDVMAAFEAAFASSRAKDQAWLDAHPAE